MTRGTTGGVHHGTIGARPQAIVTPPSVRLVAPIPWFRSSPGAIARSTAGAATTPAAAAEQLRAILNGDVTDAFRYLAFQERAEWSDSVQREHSGSIEHRHQHFDMSGLTDGEVAAIAEIAERHRRDSLS